MSEIFEALQKAQRRTETQPEGSEGERAAEGDRGHAGEAPWPEPVAGPAPSRARRKGWLSRLARGNGRNGHGEHPPLLTSPLGSAMREQFRVLRTVLELNGPGAIMISSALDQEGKTLCAANLAVTMAMRFDTRVLLIDSDLRRPSVAAYFGLPADAKPGLIDCLLAEARWQDCLVATEYERLRVLPAGRCSTLGPELIASQRMKTIVEELKAENPHEYILFDTPPILLTADPLALARHMDRCILVARAGVTPRAAVLKAAQTLGGERLLGVVLNDATDNLSHYFHYSYYSGSSYYDRAR
jgi:protein-tyrosine kinase